jgi:hypothetical protein
MREISDCFGVFFLGAAVVGKTVYKGRKKKTIEYFAVKSVDKSQRSKVLNEVSWSPPRCCWNPPESKAVRCLHWCSRLGAVGGIGIIHVLVRVCRDSHHLFDKSTVALVLGCSRCPGLINCCCRSISGFWLVFA